MDVGTLAIIAAGGAVIGVAAYLALPRYPEDYFELSNAELLELTTASGHPSLRPRRAARATTAEDHRPGCGTHGCVESSESPPPISASDRFLPGPATGGAAVQSQGGPVSFTFDEGSGVVPVVRHRDRPVLFLVSSK